MTTRPQFFTQAGKQLIALAGLAFYAWPSLADALEVRAYDPARHDRFTGFPAAPAFNETAYYDSRKFTGIGWIPGEVDGRQLALITPQHVVFALHYRPEDGTKIRFLNSAGQTIDRTVTSHASVYNSQNLATDLCVLRLSAPLTEADGVTFFPYLNLANDVAYVGQVLTIFGKEMKAGRAVIAGISSFSTTGVNSTRMMRYNYEVASGNADDAYLVTGDSGSPAFATANGAPAILGVHTAAGASDSVHTTYDSFIPRYIAELNAILVSDGYQMTPTTPPVVTLSGSLSTGPVLRQAMPGSCQFLLQNGPTDAGNTRVALQFPAGTGPDSITAADWIVEQTGTDDWALRRAKLPASGSSTITATWTKLPAVSSIAIGFTRAADGSAKTIQTFTLPLAPSFAAWADGLADTSAGGDTDGDGIGNLLEYAFGGDPRTSSVHAIGGANLLPALSLENGSLVLRFAVRDDRATRGLTYDLEFSETLAEGSWSAAPPAGFLDQLAPAAGGYQQRTISWDADVPKRFCRVRIGLSE